MELSVLDWFQFDVQFGHIANSSSRFVKNMEPILVIKINEIFHVPPLKHLFGIHRGNKD